MSWQSTHKLEPVGARFAAMAAPPEENFLTEMHMAVTTEDEAFLSCAIVCCPQIG
jgi:hypothetical protein